MLQSFWLWVASHLPVSADEVLCDGYTLLLSLPCFISCLLAWRLWTFTIHPYLFPQSPKELPYWIPFFGSVDPLSKPMKETDSANIGHSLAFFSNSDKLLERGLDYTGRTHEIYTIKVWRQKLYIITAPEDVATAYKNNTSLNFDGHLNELLVNFGFKGEALRLAWHTPQPGDSCYLADNPVNPQQKSLNRLTEEVYKKQLLPGERMDVMCKVFITALKASLTWTGLDFCTLAYHGDRKRISLKALCRYAMVDAATRSMFGGHLHKIEPDIIQHMLGFNDFAWMVFFRYPDMFGSPVSAPRAKIIEALKVFINLPEKERSEQAWSIKTILAAQKIVGIDLQSRASIILMIYWAANSNEYNISFWVLGHLLFNQNLMELVQVETEAAWQSGTLDIKYLCAHSPTLDALFCEALRLNGGAMVSRKVLETTEIGGKVLQPGNSVIIPSRQLHKNKDVWGSDVNEFDAFRFAKNKSLARHSSYRPFGGGVTYCPGRVLAKEEVFGFVAILLHRFSIKLAQLGDGKGDRQVFPLLDESSPALGITGPAKGMDIIVDMSTVDSSD